MNATAIYQMDASEAAAELLVRHLRQAGNVRLAARDGDTVAFTTSGDGFHLGNVQTDYDVDVHLVCEAEGIESGPLADDIDPEDTVYANMKVHGVADDYEGYALPTHAAKMDGAYLHDDLDNNTERLAQRAGVCTNAEGRLLQLEYAPNHVPYVVTEDGVEMVGQPTHLDMAWDETDSWWCPGCDRSFEGVEAAIEHVKQVAP